MDNRFEKVNDYPTGPCDDDRPQGRGEYGRFSPHTGYYSGMVAWERDEKILELRRKGWTLKRIGQAVGMSTSGVSDALKRLAEPADPRRPRQGVDPRG